MRIEERLARRAPEDIIHIGGIIEHTMKGEFWSILKMLGVSLKVDEIERAKNGIGVPISSERVLGRIEAHQTMLDALEAIVIQRNELQKPVESKKQTADDGAEEIIDREEVYEPAPLKYGGSI